MALDTYANLQLEIADYLNRTDLTTNIPTFIQLAESKLNRELRLREQEQLSYWEYDPADNTTRIPLPTGFIEFISLKFRKESESDKDYAVMRYLDPRRIQERYSQDPGPPAFYTLRDQLEINVLPDVVYRLRMHYIKQWQIATDSTNWLLTTHPDAYLFGALANAAPFLKDDSRAAGWISAWNDVIRGLNEVAERGRDDAELDASEYDFGRRYRVDGILNGW